MGLFCLGLFCLGLCLPTVWGNSLQAQATETWRSWNQPVEPFRIAGNLYYVGATDIAAYLVTTPEGHIVIDGGFPETAPLIRDSITALGFDITDVKILLNSHAHFDHSGGLAALQAWSGAEVWIHERDAPIIESGGKGDFFLDADDAAFPPVGVDRRLKHGDSVTLGDTTLTAHLTAGHTKGCTTWSMEVEDGDSTLLAVSVCSTSVLPGLDLIDNAAYPEIADDYARTFERLEALDCDIFLAPHGQFIDLDRKRQEMKDPSTQGNPFVDPEGYREYVAKGKRRFSKVLEEQRAEATPPQRG